MLWLRKNQPTRSAGRGGVNKDGNQEITITRYRAPREKRGSMVDWSLFLNAPLRSVLRKRAACAALAGVAALVASSASAQLPLVKTSSGKKNDVAKLVTPTDAPRPVLIRGVRFTGNYMISSARLTAALPPLPAPVDFATLKDISNHITRYYRTHGYPFAYSYFPPQESSDGILSLMIMEGQFGQITVKNTSALSTPLAHRMLETNLCGRDDCSYTPITAYGLQRASLLLSDQPGVVATSSFQRGQAMGTSDLNMQLMPAQRFQFRGGVDNFGTSSTGNWRGSVGGSANELLGRGDKFNFDFVGSGQKLWNGLVSYSMLLSPSGLRGGISAGRTHYELGGEFKDLQVNGYANTFDVSMTYPIVRSLATNLNAGLDYQHESLHDNIGEAEYYARRKLDNAIISLDGNRSDNFWFGGFNEFSLGFTYGDVHGLDAETLDSDQDPQHGLFTKGGFSKFTFAVDRQQNLPGPFGIFAAVNGQVASKNLVSAEQFYVGGPAGVRAYAVGEGSGDTGIISTVELRYMVPFRPLPGSLLTLASFYDNGLIRRDQDPPPGVTKNTADYGGAGLRLGLQKQNRYNFNLIWAHRIGGQSSAIEPGKNNFFWVQLSFQY